MKDVLSNLLNRFFVVSWVFWCGFFLFVSFVSFRGFSLFLIGWLIVWGFLCGSFLVLVVVALY